MSAPFPRVGLVERVRRAPRAAFEGPGAELELGPVKRAWPQGRAAMLAIELPDAPYGESAGALAGSLLEEAVAMLAGEGTLGAARPGIEARIDADELTRELDRLLPEARPRNWAGEHVSLALPEGCARAWLTGEHACVAWRAAPVESAARRDLLRRYAWAANADLRLAQLRVTDRELQLCACLPWPEGTRPAARLALGISACVGALRAARAHLPDLTDLSRSDFGPLLELAQGCGAPRRDRDRTRGHRAPQGRGLVPPRPGAVRSPRLEFHSSARQGETS